MSHQPFVPKDLPEAVAALATAEEASRRMANEVVTARMAYAAAREEAAFWKHQAEAFGKALLIAVLCVFGAVVALAVGA